MLGSSLINTLVCLWESSDQSISLIFFPFLFGFSKSFAIYLLFIPVSTSIFNLLFFVIIDCILGTFQSFVYASYTSQFDMPVPSEHSRLLLSGRTNLRTLIRHKYGRKAFFGREWRFKQEITLKLLLLLLLFRFCLLGINRKYHQRSFLQFNAWPTVCNMASLPFLWLHSSFHEPILRLQWSMGT